MSAATYHLWFKPTGAAYDITLRIIRELARELNAPSFEPHVSLTGNLEGTEEEIIQRTGELAHRLDAFKVTLVEPAYLDTHFQCLFMSVEPTPQIMNAYAIATDFFHKPQQAFMPHLSLVYGSYPESRKQSIIASLPGDLRTSFGAGVLILVRADSMDPKDWHEIGAFSMSTRGVSVTQ